MAVIAMFIAISVISTLVRHRQCLENQSTHGFQDIVCGELNPDAPITYGQELQVERS